MCIGTSTASLHPFPIFTFAITFTFLLHLPNSTNHIQSPSIAAHDLPIFTKSKLYAIS
eukprot:UN23795